jgi:hypothetical protein
VRVCLKSKLRIDPCPLDHASEPSSTERCPALRGEHERRLWLLLALQPPQGPQFIPEDGMRTRSALPVGHVCRLQGPSWRHDYPNGSLLPRSSSVLPQSPSDIRGFAGQRLEVA